MATAAAAAAAAGVGRHSGAPSTTHDRRRAAVFERFGGSSCHSDTHRFGAPLACSFAALLVRLFACSLVRRPAATASERRQRRRRRQRAGRSGRCSRRLRSLLRSLRPLPPPLLLLFNKRHLECARSRARAHASSRPTQSGKVRRPQLLAVDSKVAWCSTRARTQNARCSRRQKRSLCTTTTAECRRDERDRGVSAFYAFAAAHKGVNHSRIFVCRARATIAVLPLACSQQLK